MSIMRTSLLQVPYGIFLIFLFAFFRVELIKAAEDGSPMFQVQASGFGVDSRTPAVRKPAAYKQYSAPSSQYSYAQYSNSYTSPTSGSLTSAPYGYSVYQQYPGSPVSSNNNLNNVLIFNTSSFSSPAAGQLVSSYGSSNGALTAAPSPVYSSGSATSYGGFNSYSSQSQSSSLTNYGSAAPATSAQIVQQVVSVTSAPTQQSYSYSASYGPSNGALVATGGSSYGGSSASLVATPAPVQAPVCSINTFNTTMPDSTPVGTVVRRILAVDPQGLPVQYQIIDPVFGSFVIDSQTGQITVASNLVNFADAIEFTVQASNTQNQVCTTNVRIDFTKTSIPAAPLIAYSGGSSYGGSSSGNLVATPAPYSTGGSYGSSSSNLVAAPAPAPYSSGSASYSSSSSNLVATPAPYSSGSVGYGGSSSNLVATPAPYSTGGSYGSSSGNLVATPAPYSSSYGSATGNLVATLAPYPIGGSYGSSSSGNLVAASAPYTSNSYGSSSSNLVATPAPYSTGGSYSSGSSGNFVAAPGPYSGGGYGSVSSGNLVATPAPVSYSGGTSYGSSSGSLAAAAPAPVSFDSYGGSSSSNFVATPAPYIANYGTSSNLVSSGGSSYGSSSSGNLVATPAPYSSGGSYGGSSSSNLVAAPAPYGNSYGSSSNLAASGNSYSSSASNLVATPAPYSSGASYGGSSSSNLVATPAPYGGSSNLFSSGSSYGSSSSGNLVAAPAPYSTGGSYGGSSSGNLVSAPAYYADGYAATSGNLVSGGSSYGGFASPAPSAPLVCLPAPSAPLITVSSQSAPLIVAPSQPSFPAGTIGGTVGGGAPVIRAPLPAPATFASDDTPTSSSTMNWSFFVPSYAGQATQVGSLSSPGGGAVQFALSGSSFFVVDPSSGVVTLKAGYCPTSSPMQEVMTVRAVTNGGTSAVVQGNLTVVVFLTPAYLKSCSALGGATTGSPVSIRDVTAATGSGTSTASVSFIGDTSFRVTQCNGQTNVGPQVAGTIRARFSSNVDFSTLRITLSNTLFRPALPVLCDSVGRCNITVLFAQPVDPTFQGSYVPSIILEGGGLTRSTQTLQVQVVCNDQAADQVPLLPRSSPVNGTIIPDIPVCGVQSVSADINEDVPVGSVATTLPTNSDPAFHYQIVDASSFDYFDLVAPASITVASPLSQPTVDSVFLRVIGMIGNNTVCGTDVYIGILNVNRNKPVFDQPNYNFAIDCGLPMSQVGIVSASDIDAGRNNIKRFFVAPEDTPLVIVDPASGTIRLRRAITDSTSFTVFVQNPNTKLQSSTQVQISCTGSNVIPGVAGPRSASGRSFTTSTPKPPVLRTEAKKPRPVVTSNKPVSFPFSVVFSGNSTVTTTTTPRPRTTVRRAINSNML